MGEIAVDITIQQDGGIMVQRGTKEQNAMLLQILDGGIKDQQSLLDFISMVENAEIIIGDVSLCG